MSSNMRTFLISVALPLGLAIAAFVGGYEYAHWVDVTAAAQPKSEESKVYVYYYDAGGHGDYDVPGHSSRIPHITGGGGGHSVWPPADGSVYWFKITQESTTCTQMKAEEPQR